jgi:hypothetical protein
MCLKRSYLHPHFYPSGTVEPADDTHAALAAWGMDNAWIVQLERKHVISGKK